MTEYIKYDNTYSPTIVERLKGEALVSLHMPIRCVYRYAVGDYNRKWSYSEKGFDEGDLCWVRSIGKLEDQPWKCWDKKSGGLDKNAIYFRVEAEQFEALQPSSAYLTLDMLRKHFKATELIKRDCSSYGVSYA